MTWRRACRTKEPGVVRRTRLPFYDRYVWQNMTDVTARAILAAGRVSSVMLARGGDQLDEQLSLDLGEILCIYLFIYCIYCLQSYRL